MARPGPDHPRRAVTLLRVQVSQSRAPLCLSATDFLHSCITARRRRKMGYQPYRGTGWALRGHGPVQYNQNAQPYYQNAQPYYNNSNNPPPAYTPPPNQGYYGQQNHNGPYGNDVELQQPQNTYGGYGRQEQGVYEPPKGPPPAHVQ